jgi:asparagine synthase (glutamine-hydrolysing)
MCGILALINYIISDVELYKKAIESGKNRGPEETKIEKGELYELIFHRLAINGLTTDSGQPFNILGCKLICNG